MRPALLSRILFATVALCAAAVAQNVISLKAGIVNVADGDVFVAGKKFAPKASEIIHVQTGESLRTEEGRTELLLTPGTFLRMPEFSEVVLESSDLADVRLRLVHGTALVEVTELLEGNKITLLVGDAAAIVAKAGLYRLEEDPMRVRVYDGEVLMKVGGEEVRVKRSHELAATPSGWTDSKFDTKDTDGLFRWSRRRSEYVAMANLSAARRASGTAGAWPGRTSGWVYNSFLGTYTFVPMFSTAGSFFGSYFYTPFNVGRAYYQRPRITLPAPGSGYGAGGIFASGPYGGGSGMPPRSASGSYGGGGASAGSSGSGAPSGGGGASAGGSARGGEGAGARGGGEGGGRQ